MKNTKKIQREFQQSIRNGTGRAFILMNKYPNIDFSKEILKSSLKNYAYDGQSEGDRSEYSFQFIKKLPNETYEGIKKIVLERLFEENEDTWNLQQLFNLTRHFAEEDKKTKKAIYKRFKQTPISNSDWLGTEAIIKLDGLKGMIKIVKYFGKKLMENKNDWQDDMLINSFNTDLPNLEIKKILKKAAKKNKYIEKYLEEIKENRKRWEKAKSKRKIWNIELIIESIENDNSRIPVFYILKGLNKPELKQIGTILKSKPNLKQTEKILYIFSRNKYPYNLNDLKEYTNKKYSKLIREYALGALSYFKDQELRKLALKKLQKTKHPSKYLDLLKSNYKEGDSVLISKVIIKCSDEYIIENMAISLCEVYKINKTKDCKKPLLALYEKMNCAIHRNSVVNLLYKNNVLPNKILKEIRYDSDEDTRYLYHEIKKKASNNR